MLFIRSIKKSSILTPVSLIFLMCVYLSASAAEKYSSFLPGKIWLDDANVPINAHGGGILYYDKTYYWFGQHMVEGSRGNQAWVGVHCYSSKDLYNWKDEGISLNVDKDPNSEITAGCLIERPKVIYNVKTGKFVMWFHLELKGRGYSAARAGVAVSDKVTGPYKYLGSFRPNAGVWPINVTDDQKKILETKDSIKTFSGGFEPNISSYNLLARDFAKGQMARDMTLFVDDDSKAYHIYASEENSTMHISLLTDDYLTPAGKYVRIFEGKYREAPAIFKRNGKYYLITSGCTGWNPNEASLASADSIWVPWKDLGNPCRGTESQNQTTFESQSTYILPVQDMNDAFIFIADRWHPNNAIDGRYIWLPIQWEQDKPFLKWLDNWSLDFFKKKSK